MGCSLLFWGQGNSRPFFFAAGQLLWLELGTGFGGCAFLSGLLLRGLCAAIRFLMQSP